MGPLAPPHYIQPGPPSTILSSLTPSTSGSVTNASVSPPPVPPRNKPPARQVSSLPIDLTTSALTNHMVGAIQHMARRISRKKRPAPHVSLSDFDETDDDSTAFVLAVSFPSRLSRPLNKFAFIV